MINIQRRKFLLMFAIILPCLDSRKFGGGGGGFRGSSGARTSGGGFGGGGGPAAGGGGFRPQPAGGGFHGGPMAGGNFRPPSGGGPGHFGGGSGLGSASRGASFKTALAGAALGTVGGLLAFEAGKAIIRNFDQPFHNDGRDYYWGNDYVRKRPGEFVCSMPFDTLIQQSNPSATTQVPAANGTAQPTPEQALSQATFPNGTRPKQIVWTCKERVEVCCGTDCCPNDQYYNSASRDGHSVMGVIGKVLLGIFVVGLLLCCCCALIAYKFCRTAFDKIMPHSNYQSDTDHTKYDSPGGGGDQYPQQQAQAYPMQPYPAGPTYPAQPQPPSAYPPPPASYPPAPGYYEQNKY